VVLRLSYFAFNLEVAMEGDNIFFKVFILYMFFWIVLGEKVDFQITLAGIFVISMVLIWNFGKSSICYKGKRYLNYKRGKLFVSYLFLLMKEIVIASLQVAKIVLSRELNISPQVIKFKTRLTGNLYKTILANSITLTPGTLTIEVNDNEFTVHCISKNQIDDVVNSKFEKLLLKIEEQS
jgi:multicomponent Na+:H+ antiporter subunit E